MGIHVNIMWNGHSLSPLLTRPYSTKIGNTHTNTYHLFTHSFSSSIVRYHFLLLPRV
ncbi:hypothetical protein GBAR_LOCUS13686 [Geodia barretti]|uniref:Uncharacterized protein n=1 Tax=Geodia barretti TaxID=519541 RepID=A0AA35WNJ6_GEOBA|nr:hypothetical protein GBAR_LOCUS13686 [Geodia barretti]